MRKQTRARPELHPVQTSVDDRKSSPTPSAMFSATSSLFPAITRTDGLLSPICPPQSPGYDLVERKRRRAVDEHHDRREKYDAPLTMTARSLSPISEHMMSDRRPFTANLPPPSARVISPLSPDPHPEHSRGPTLAEETRSILLSGLPNDATRQEAAAHSPPSDRRQSLPASILSARRSSIELQQKLEERGRTYNSVYFVAAVALRRASDSSSSVNEGESGKTSPIDGDTVTIRARIRPCAPDRKPFLVKRTFDRTTLPELPSLGARRLSAISPRSSIALSPNPRRSSVAVEVDFGPSGADKSPVRCSNPVPIRKCHSPL